MNFMFKRRQQPNFFVQQLGGKRERLFPDNISPARDTRANSDQRGAWQSSPLETPSPLTREQAPEISCFKKVEQIVMYVKCTPHFSAFSPQTWAVGLLNTRNTFLRLPITNEVNRETL